MRREVADVPRIDQSRTGEFWEPWEDKLLQDESLSAAEVAVQVKRGTNAVQDRRRKTFGMRAPNAPARPVPVINPGPVPITVPKPPGNPHGSEWMWQRGCSCEGCRRGESARRRKRKQAAEQEARGLQATGRRGGPGRKWTAAEVDLLWDRTLSPVQIAEMTGRTPAQVSSARKARGVIMQQVTVRRVGGRLITTVR